MFLPYLDSLAGHGRSSIFPSLQKLSCMSILGKRQSACVNVCTITCMILGKAVPMQDSDCIGANSFDVLFTDSLILLSIFVLNTRLRMIL